MPGKTGTTLRSAALGASRRRPGVAAGLGVAALLAGQAVVDARRVRRDPARALLADPPEGRKVDVRGTDGTRLHVDVLGPEDAPTVVLVHGWTCRREFWAPQLNALADRYRLVTYDQRGHGRSERPRGGDFTPEALGDDLEAVLRATVGDGRRAVLVGHSLGAMSIVSWAGRYRATVRDRAAAALLLSTGMKDLITESLILKPPAGLSKPAAALAARGMAAPVPYGFRTPLTHRIVRYVALSPSATPAQVSFCERIVLGAERRGRAATARTLSTLDLESAIEHLAVPTAVLSGTADRLTPPVLAERLAARLPQLVERVVLPGIGHMTPVEVPLEVNGRIETMVRDHLPEHAPLGASATPISR
jgi:pimeloyl-ACP methyl ester carboxylesterase